MNSELVITVAQYLDHTDVTQLARAAPQMRSTLVRTDVWRRAIYLLRHKFRYRRCLRAVRQIDISAVDDTYVQIHCIKLGSHMVRYISKQHKFVHLRAGMVLDQPSLTIDGKETKYNRVISANVSMSSPVGTGNNRTIGYYKRCAFSCVCGVAEELCWLEQCEIP
jgi:hypothetical protein